MTGTQDPEQLQREIDETRAELGDTVEALARKADVKAQARQKVQETKASVSEKLGKVGEASPDGTAVLATQASQKARENPLPVAAIGAFAAGFLAGRLTKR